MRRDTGGPLVAALLLVLLVVAVYWPVGGFGFVRLDDGLYISRNPHVLSGFGPDNVRWAFTTLHAGFWIPLTWLSLMLDASLWGPGAGGFHLTNVALHAAATVLFFLLLRRLLGTSGVPLLAAALFAAHPLHVESVAWATERKDVLSQALLLGFLHAWVRHVRRPSAGRHAVALSVLALALMAKPIAFTTPALLLVLDWWPFGRLRGAGPRRAAALVAEKIPVALLGLGFGIVTLVAQGRSGAMTPLALHSAADRAANAAVTMAQGLARFVWPSGLGPFYPGPPGGVFPPPTVAAGAALLGALAAAAFLVRRRQPWVAAGLAWYLVGLVPVLMVIGGLQVTADRFNYLPLLGIHLAAACTAFGLAGAARRPGRAVALLALPALLAAVAHRQVYVWRDGESQMRRALAVSRDVAFIRQNLGAVLLEAGRAAEAQEHLEAALRLDPDHRFAHSDLGRLLVEQGRVEEGLAHLARAVELAPREVELRVTFGEMLLRAGRGEDAERELRAALALAPGSALVLSSLSTLRLEQGELAQARDLAEAAVRGDPSLAVAWYLLGTATARLGDPSRAERPLRRALELQPDAADFGYNLALSLLDQGRRAEASALLDGLRRQHPDDAGIGGLRERLGATH